MNRLAPDGANGWNRLRQMILGWGTVGVVYGFASLCQGRGIILPETALDRMIPYSPLGIWFYLSFFLLVPYAYFTVEAGRLLWLRRSMQLCAACSGLVFLMWPTTLHYPALNGAGVSDAILRLLLLVDSSENCLPSLHGALTSLSIWALLDGERRFRSWFAMLWGIGIAFSILQLRRHLGIDLAAGVATGIACGWLCMKRPLWRRNGGRHPA